jgi:hypothetical protein
MEKQNGIENVETLLHKKTGSCTEKHVIEIVAILQQYMAIYK